MPVDSLTKLRESSHQVDSSLARLAWCCCALSVGACTDVGLYQFGGGTGDLPDRAEFSGNVCVPVTAGELFPVKVLFAVEGGAGVDRTFAGLVAESLESLNARFAASNVTFGLVAYHALATGIQASFVDSQQLSAVLPKYASYSEEGPISVRSPLLLAKSILSGDMQTGCRGTVARTRYVVVLLMSRADTSCANPVFNAGISSLCNAYLGDAGAAGPAQCSACELARVTEELKGLAQQYGAGEVTVQPVYVTDLPDRTAQTQMQEIAKSGGTTAIQTNITNLKNAVNTLNYASLQSTLVLKRFFAYNRNSIARSGSLLVDSDGDGIPDDEEKVLGTNPIAQDSDDDGLKDGVEARMGLKPQPGNLDVLNACNVGRDEDFDGLNDCEERVLGTDACVSDSDGDGVQDLVEFHSNLNPLIAEDLADIDGDGRSNIDELLSHTDARSADVAFSADRAYGYDIQPSEPTRDGRPCYAVRAYNVGLVNTLKRPNPPGPDTLKGVNDVYFYFHVGQQNDPRGKGVSSVLVIGVQLLKTGRKPADRVISFGAEEFAVGR